jgi:hypothetical protein
VQAKHKKVRYFCCVKERYLYCVKVWNFCRVKRTKKGRKKGSGSFYRKKINEIFWSSTFDREVIWPNLRLAKLRLTERLNYRKMSFGRKKISPNRKKHWKRVIWLKIPFKNWAIWPKCHLTESSYDRKLIWPKAFFDKWLIWPKGCLIEKVHMTERQFHRTFFSTKSHVTEIFFTYFSHIFQHDIQSWIHICINKHILI